MYPFVWLCSVREREKCVCVEGFSGIHASCCQRVERTECLMSCKKGSSMDYTGLHRVVRSSSTCNTLPVYVLSYE